MKRSITALLAIFASFSVLASANDIVITFSTTGPDRYADGSIVQNGECYALVYTPKGMEFSGFAADGTIADPATGKLVLCAPVARNGRCPYVAFQVDGTGAATNYPSGTWAVYLLDTRRFGANGAVSLAGTQGGRPVVVNASGIVAEASVSQKADGSQAFNAAIADAEGVASGRTEVPAGTPRPKITDIKVIDGMVYVTVGDTVPFINYALREGAQPSSVAAGSVQDTRVGDAEREIILVSPVKGSSGFYSVDRR